MLSTAFSQTVITSYKKLPKVTKSYKNIRQGLQNVTNNLAKNDRWVALPRSLEDCGGRRNHHHHRHHHGHHNIRNDLGSNGFPHLGVRTFFFVPAPLINLHIWLSAATCLVRSFGTFRATWQCIISFQTGCRILTTLTGLWPDFWSDFDRTLTGFWPRWPLLPDFDQTLTGLWPDFDRTFTGLSLDF